MLCLQLPTAAPPLKEEVRPSELAGRKRTEVTVEVRGWSDVDTEAVVAMKSPKGEARGKRTEKGGDRMAVEGEGGMKQREEC